jgi:hypothetical protein
MKHLVTVLLYGMLLTVLMGAVGQGTLSEQARAEPHRAVATIPYLLLAPTTVPTGEEVTVYGRDFCGNDQCSPITVKIGERVTNSNVRTNPDGTFQFSFTVTEAVGRYTITATQTAADGTLLQGTVYLLVTLPGEVEGGSAIYLPLIRKH